ncbi:DUF6506 family protein [Geodermatophilus sp. URMC 60]
MTVTWAYVYEHPGADPVSDRFVIDRHGQRTLLVPVAAADDAPAVALDLVAEGVQLIELCGGFTLVAAARVTEAVGGRVPVGHVTFTVDATAGAAAYSAAFDDDDQVPAPRRSTSGG